MRVAVRLTYLEFARGAKAKTAKRALELPLGGVKMHGSARWVGSCFDHVERFEHVCKAEPVERVGVVDGRIERPVRCNQERCRFGKERAGLTFADRRRNKEARAPSVVRP